MPPIPSTLRTRASSDAASRQSREEDELNDANTLEGFKTATQSIATSVPSFPDSATRYPEPTSASLNTVTSLNSGEDGDRSGAIVCVSWKDLKDAGFDVTQLLQTRCGCCNEDRLPDFHESSFVPVLSLPVNPEGLKVDGRSLNAKEMRSGGDDVGGAAAGAVIILAAVALLGLATRGLCIWCGKCAEKRRRKAGPRGGSGGIEEIELMDEPTN